jgi:hypothetical protein
MADVVGSAGELPGAIARALANPASHRLERRAAAETLFAFAGTATDRALAVVYQLLELKRARST